jgi:glycosyltransferase involved in cell wall biosynthesis
MKETNYVVITPVRNEQKNLPLTVRSMVAQSIRPAQWIIVDDGSTDQTPSVIQAAVQGHSWIAAVRRGDRGFRHPGTGVIEAFCEGYRRLRAEEWQFLVKLDGDLSFRPDYFERCLAEFDADSLLGIGGGMVCAQKRTGLVEDYAGDPRFHVRGATKIYRRACWEAIGRLLQSPGWDTVDELKANMLGWSTRTFRDIPIVQHKPTGEADGSWRNWVKNGRANYVTGYHPAFMLAKCVRRAFRRPYLVGAVGLLWGFLSGYYGTVSRVRDVALVRYVRREQLKRLLSWPSLWS